MKRAVFIFLIIFAFTILSYEEAKAGRIVVTAEVIKIEEHPPYLVYQPPPDDVLLEEQRDFYTVSATITLRTEEGDVNVPLEYRETGYITIPINHRAWELLKDKGINIKIGDIVRINYFGPTNEWEATARLKKVATIIERIRTTASEKLRIASEQAKTQLPKAITFAKLGQIKEAIDIYLSIPEEVWTPDNIPLWNDRNDLLQALEPYVQQHITNAKSLEAKGQYRDALKEYAEALVKKFVSRGRISY